MKLDRVHENLGHAPGKQAMSYSTVAQYARNAGLNQTLKPV
jgi:hypothetical protein